MPNASLYCGAALRLASMECEVWPGSGVLLRWCVDDARLHDDLVLSLGLVGELDGMDWRPSMAMGTNGFPRCS